MPKLAHRRGQAFEATPRNGAAQVGVWDQLAALSNEYYSKEGRLSLINEQSARVGLQNFREQKNNLVATIGHDFRDGAADYNALALLCGGAVVDFASHDAALPPPTIDMLPGGDDGSPPDDGVYCYRCYISPLGQEKSALYRYISPEFFNDGELPNGKRVGLQFTGLCWTNRPFLDGVEKQRYERTPMDPNMNNAAPAPAPAAAMTMDPAMMAKCMEEAGITPADDEATKMMKMAVYSQKVKMSAAPPMPPKKEGEAEAAGAKKPDMAAARVEPTAPAELPAAASPAPAPAGGSPDVMVPGDPGLQPAGPGMAGEGGNYMSRLQAMERQAAADRAKLVKLEAEAQLRASTERKADAQLFAFEAFRRGQIPIRGSETPATAQERIANLYTAKGKEAAEAALADPGTEKRVPENVMMTFSKEGTPHGGGFQGGAAGSTNPGHELHRITMERMASEKTVGQRGAYTRTARQVATERQDLSSAWSRGVGVHPTAAPRQ